MLEWTRTTFKLREEQMARLAKSPGIEKAFNDVFPVPIKATRAPTSSDIKFPIGQLWVRTDTGQAYILVTISSGAASWALSSPGASDVDTLTGDSGGAISPAAGNITLAGGTNVTSVGSGSTITFNLDAAISLATSVTSPLFTAGAGVDVDIEAPTGQDVIIKLGDAAGSNKLSVTDSADSEVFAVDSTGGITFAALTVAGAFAQTGGTFNVGQDNAANAINIGGGSSARAIAIGNGSAAHTIAIGQSSAGAITVDTAAGVSIDAATASNFTVTGAGADLTLSSAGGRVDVLATEDTAQAVYIRANGGTSETIQIHADQGTGVSSIYLLSDAGGLTFESTGLASDDAINLVATAGGIDMDAALQINIASSENAADAIVMNASAGGIDITAAGGAAEDIDITCTSGSVNITAGEDDAAAMVLEVDGGTSERLVLHSDQGTGADSIYIYSDDGGLTLESTGLASNDAINLVATAGGIDMDAALQINIASSENAADAIVINASAGGIDITAAGAAGEDLDLACTAGSTNITAGEAAADAITIQAASGGIDVDGALQVNIASSQNAADAIRINASAGGIDIDAAGAAGEDIVITNTAGSMTLEAGESAADAMNITASGAAGAINLSAGTGGVTMDSGLVMNVVNKVAGDSPYTVLGSDYIVACDTSAGAITVTLPASPATGRMLYVVDEGGSAGANNITVSGNGKNISGSGTIAATDVIDSNYGTLQLIYNGTFWNAFDVA